MTELETSYGRLEERQTESRHRLIAIPAVRHKASCIRSQSVDREPEEKSSPEHQVSYSIKHINWGQKKKKADRCGHLMSLKEAIRRMMMRAVIGR